MNAIQFVTRKITERNTNAKMNIATYSCAANNHSRRYLGMAIYGKALKAISEKVLTPFHKEKR
jgi:hypothetical protein